jgi:hypothetical protein
MGHPESRKLSQKDRETLPVCPGEGSERFGAGAVIGILSLFLNK